MTVKGLTQIPHLHLRSYHYLGRRRRIAILVIGALVLITLFSPAVPQLRGYPLKWLPTSFESLHENLENLALPHPFRFWSGGEDGLDVDGRYLFQKNLAAGQEGSIGLYWDKETDETVAIKTFTSRHRNPIPLEIQERFMTATAQISHWPTEIEAGLLLSHLYRSSPPDIIDGSSPAAVPFTTPRDYFVIEYPYRYPAKSPVWHMVTSYLPSGSLKQFMRTARSRDRSMSISEYERLLRSTVFKDLFSNLQWLHDTGYCHNDIKPSNIFVEAGFSEDEDIPSRLLLGDLGNVREIDHPYYRSTIWGPERNQWVDCIANDVRRLLKSYLFYLRETVDRDWFDFELYAEREEWSRLYWSFIRSPGDVRHLRNLERDIQSPSLIFSAKSFAEPESDVDLDQLSLREREILDASVARELKCNSLGINFLDWWRLGGFWQPYVLEDNSRRRHI
ncbi:hypothetical protein P152DRAFT_181096 [Eremomyces bilateralis CBS 781.70]|uniref:Protein kinase domain-containing protein n=1 Tax=Eremomyces bilateralis CBS 781.70 TaxID=1392243 RepID=A0A6G1GBH2_9PEZI|nr:uncharacterized protein P152DRAFT_181096 [Eremomyces bilateralis CBS 781.70]KAF1815286.1 hypothetical protein P152DRAFT_181096 [Eremomyces bilateralis CBS 781.70]